MHWPNIQVRSVFEPREERHGLNILCIKRGQEKGEI